MTDRTEAMDNLIAQDADLIDASPAQRDALQVENEQLRHDLERQMTIANEQVNEVERLRIEAQAQFDRGYYDGCANPIVRYDALREALVDLLHAVCGKTGFAETVRRDSGRIYPWPALDLAEAKALEALERSK